MPHAAGRARPAATSKRAGRVRAGRVRRACFGASRAGSRVVLDCATTGEMRSWRGRGRARRRASGGGRGRAWGRANRRVWRGASHRRSRRGGRGRRRKGLGGRVRRGRRRHAATLVVCKGHVARGPGQGGGAICRAVDGCSHAGWAVLGATGTVALATTARLATIAAALAVMMLPAFAAAATRTPAGLATWVSLRLERSWAAWSMRATRTLGEGVIPWATGTFRASWAHRAGWTGWTGWALRAAGWALRPRVCSITRTTSGPSSSRSTGRDICTGRRRLAKL